MRHVQPEGTGGAWHTPAAFHSTWIITSTRHGSAVATSISIPRSAAAAEDRDPRSTAVARSAKGHDRRRPKAGVGACRPSQARTCAEEAPIRVRKGPFDPPLCVSPRVCPSDAMLLPSSAIRHSMAPLRPAQVPPFHPSLMDPGSSPVVGWGS